MHILGAGFWRIGSGLGGHFGLPSGCFLCCSSPFLRGPDSLGRRGSFSFQFAPSLYGIQSQNGKKWHHLSIHRSCFSSVCARGHASANGRFSSTKLGSVDENRPGLSIRSKAALHLGVSSAKISVFFALRANIRLTCQFTGIIGDET